MNLDAGDTIRRYLDFGPQKTLSKSFLYFNPFQPKLFTIFSLNKAFQGLSLYSSRLPLFEKKALAFILPFISNVLSLLFTVAPRAFVTIFYPNYVPYVSFIACSFTVFSNHVSVVVLMNMFCVGLCNYCIIFF